MSILQRITIALKTLHTWDRRHYKLFKLLYNRFMHQTLHKFNLSSCHELLDSRIRH
jgi:hypothetical protein